MSSWSEPFQSPLSRQPVALAQAFALIGRHLAAAATTRDALSAITDLTLEVVPGARWVSITRGHADGWSTVASTDPVAVAVDRLQYTCGSGPCLDAVTDGATLSSDDLSVELRWPRFSARAARTHATFSVLSIRLTTDGDEDLNAGLNVYGDIPHAFTDDSRLLGLLLAAHAAIALGAVVNREKSVHMAAALESNRTIGMAMGIMMASQKITSDQAFGLLRIRSQSTNTKLRDVAYDVTETGMLELPPGL